MKKFNFDDYRVKDLDEIVSLVKKEEKGFDAKASKYSYFVLGKDCYMFVYYNPENDEVNLSISNSLIKEERTYGVESPVQFQSVDLNAVAENFLVFNYLANNTSIFKRRSADPVKSHLLLTNVERALGGELTPKVVSKIVTAEEYSKAIERAQKAFNKEQYSTIDSQTPQYDC